MCHIVTLCSGSSELLGSWRFLLLFRRSSVSHERAADQPEACCGWSLHYSGQQVHIAGCVCVWGGGGGTWTLHLLVLLPFFLLMWIL